MLLHNHESEEGPLLVLHVNREEAEQLVSVITAALESNPDGENFSVNLGHTEHLHGAHEDDEEGQVSS